MNIVKHFTELAGGLLAAVLCLLGITACNDEKEVVVPDNWIILSEETLSCTYEQDTLTVNYTLAGGLDDKYMYIVNQQEWCKAYTSAPGVITVAVDASTLLSERSASMTVVYDETHQVKMTLTQGSAPIIVITDFKLDAIPVGMDIQDTLMLNDIIEPVPSYASYQEFKYNIPEESQGAITIDENGMLISRKAGTYTFTVTSPDKDGFSKEATVTIGDYYNRSGWKVETSMTYAPEGVEINYVPDNETGMPEDMFDNNTETFFCLVKPGQTNNGCSTPADAELWFTIDLGAEGGFNAFALSHRTDVSSEGLRINELTLYGSNDGEKFTKLGENYTIDTSTTTVEINLPETYQYRYVKVLYTKWNTASSKSVQISEFNLINR